MGHQSRTYQKESDVQKEKLLAQPGMEVFEKLQKFYKLHPHGTPAVKQEVDRIRQESEAFSKALQEKFEAEHGRLVAEYLQKELDYLESYLSPDQKKQEEYSGPGMPSPKKEGIIKRFVKSMML